MPASIFKALSPAPSLFGLTAHHLQWRLMSSVWETHTPPFIKCFDALLLVLVTLLLFTPRALVSGNIFHCCVNSVPLISISRNFSLSHSSVAFPFAFSFFSSRTSSLDDRRCSEVTPGGKIDIVFLQLYFVIQRSGYDLATLATCAVKSLTPTWWPP